MNKFSHLLIGLHHHHTYTSTAAGLILITQLLLFCLGWVAVILSVPVLFLELPMLVRTALRHFAALCTTISAKLTDNKTLFIIPYLGVIDSLCLSCTTGHHFQRCYLRRSRQSSPMTKLCFVISTERSDEKSMQALPRYFTAFGMTI